MRSGCALGLIHAVCLQRSRRTFGPILDLDAGFEAVDVAVLVDSHATKALLVSRALLVKIKRDIENQIRGLLKNLWLVVGRAKMNVFAARAAELAEARPELTAAVEPLLKAREAVGRQIADLDRKVMRLARNDAQVRRFMTAPGVGPITALCFLATIDDPTRFKRSRSVGAYDQTIRIRRDRLDGPNLEMRRRDAAKLSLRGSQCPAHPGSLKPGVSGLRSEAGCAKPRLRSLESWPSFCTECGSKARIQMSSKEAANQPS